MIYSRRQFLSLRSLILASWTVCHCNIRGNVGSATLQRHDVIYDVAFPAFGYPVRLMNSARSEKLRLILPLLLRLATVDFFGIDDLRDRVEMVFGATPGGLILRGFKGRREAFHDSSDDDHLIRRQGDQSLRFDSSPPGLIAVTTSPATGIPDSMRNSARAISAFRPVSASTPSTY